MTIETEIKIAISPDRWESLRRHQRLILVHPRTFEDNWLFDTPACHLAKQHCLLRLRRYGDRIELTWKEPVLSVPENFKVRKEITITVSDLDATRTLLERLGYTVWFRYQKYRSLYRFNELQIMLDETPIGMYVELEGEPQAIETTLQQWGWPDLPRITATYYDLFVQARCEGRFHGEHLVFPPPSTDRDPHTT